jgi:hypothetical protein
VRWTGTLTDPTLGYVIPISVVCDPTFPFQADVYQVSIIGTIFSNLPQGSPYIVYQRLAIP